MGVVDPGLQTLFLLLRSAGIAVGLEEIRRLGAVFATAPALDEDGLRQVVEAVVVKSIDQQTSFRHIYDQWLDVVEQQLGKAEAYAAHHHAVREHKKNSVLSALSSVPEVLRRTRTGPMSGPDKPALLPSPMRPVELPTGPIDTAQGLAGGADKHTARSSAKHKRSGLGGMDKGLLLDKPHPTEAVKLGPVPSQAGKRVTRGLMTMAAMGVFVSALWSVLSAGPPGNVSPAESDAGSNPANMEIKRTGRDHRRPVYVPRLQVVHAHGPPFNYMGYGLAALAMTLGAGLWLRRGRGRWLPEVGRAQEPPGIAVVTHAAPVHTSVSALFLDSRDEENLVWGVGRFVADERGRDLDVDRTVSDTAAAFGRPVLRYASARYQREVWLWVDESLDSPAARHLARDLTRTLEASGLPVVRATFWGIPYQLVTETDEVVTVDELDARRDTAVVAVLTDGRLMHAANRTRERGDELRSMLRNLSFWPRVTFIDFGRERGRLAAMVEPHGLRVSQPQDAPAAISDMADAGERTAYERLVGDARVWAAACALSPRAVDDPTALMLRRMLGLKVSPWAIETLRQSAHSTAGGLSWSSQGRAALLSWLLDAEELPERGTPPPGSLLARTVTAWDRLLDEREHAQRQSMDPWEGSRAQELLRLERAFLHLWDRPEEATAELYDLFHRDRLQPIIRHHLGHMTPREGADHAHSIPLPWSLRDRRHESQVVLTEMGFGAGAGLGGRRSLPRPGRLLLALGLCAGAILGTGSAIVEERLTRQPHEPELLISWPADEKLPFMSKTPVGESRWMVEAWTPWPEDRTWQMVETDQDYVLHHRAMSIECVDTSTPGMEIRRCCNTAMQSAALRERQGAERQGAEKAPRKPWRLAILRRYESIGGEDEPGRRIASDLADELMCSGTTDAVYLLDPDAAYPADWSTWGHSPDDAQLLIVDEAPPPQLAGYPGRAVVIALDDLAELLTVTEFEGKQPLAERRGKLNVLAGSLEDFDVLGLGPCGELAQRCCAGPAQGSASFCGAALECRDGICAAVSASPCTAGEPGCAEDAEDDDAGSPEGQQGNELGAEPGKKPDPKPGKRSGR